MISRIKNLIKEDQFIRNNIILFAGSMTVAVLNYIYHPILSRMMTVEDFGEVQVLISIFLQASIILGIFGTIIVNLTANHQKEQNKNSVINQLYKIALVFSFVLTFGIIIATPVLKSFLHFHSVIAFWAIAISLPVSVELTFRKFYLQGRKEFKQLSAVSILFAGGRLVIAIFLVWLGWRAFGAILAITLTTIISLWYVYQKTHKEFKLSLREKIIFNEALKNEFKYGGLILIITSFVTFLYTADMIFVKHYFSDIEAGFYGGVSTIARIIYFITGSVTGVLIASVKIKNSFQENWKVLSKGLVIISLIGLSATSIFILFPELVIKLMIGERYVDYAYLLPKMAIVLFFASVVNMILMYFLALRKYFVIKISILISILIISSTIFNHSNLISIVNNFLVGIILAIIILAISLFKFYKKVN